MSVTRTLATARRVLQQLSHDRRSIALMVLMPSVLLVIFKYVYYDNPMVFDRIGPQMLGLFPFIIMFLITSITMLRERTSGTLERLMTLPMSKLDLLMGYGLAFGVVATAQAVVVCAVGFGLLGLNAPHGVLLVGALAILNALLGMALGLFLSAFARTEFQAVQFMPAFI